MLKKMAPFVGKYWRQTILAPLTIIVEVLLEVRIPLLMADIVNIGVTNGDVAYIARTGLWMILLSLLSLLFGALSARFSSTAGAGFAMNLREALFNKIQDFSFANVDRFSTASLVTRLTTDVNNTQQSFMMVTRMAVRAPVMLVCAVIMAVRINANLAVIFLLALPVLAASMGLIMRFAYPRFEKMLKEYDGMNGAVQEDLIGIRVVKAFVREDHETQRFRKAAEKVRNAQIKAEKIIIWNMPIMQFVMYACMIAIAWFGGNRIIAGSMLTGDLMSFISYTTQILMSLMMFGMVFMMMVISRASRQRIIEVLEEPIDIKEPEANALGQHGLTHVADGSVDFHHVDFSYSKNPENLTLRDIDLHIRSGETIGVIGGTGAAKTTLVQLIPRLYDVLDGSVTVGGKDVREYDLTALRNAVAMVLQKNVLFSGTIRENLKWGNPDATEEQIQAACRAAAAHDFIMSFPKGYDTDLGQGGVNVSGGQKQRLCIARALLKHPKIMILDDSTSAVDTATDASIRKALRENLAGMTTIIIAQRIASVMDADRILVLNEGQVADIGTHEELMGRNEIYRDVYTSQQKGAQEDGTR